MSLIKTIFLNFVLMINISNGENLKRAVVLGATGATGKEVVQALLSRNWSVTTVTRRSVEVNNNDRVTEIITNFTNTDELISKWNGHDALFNCVGTTRGQAGSADAFVDVEVRLTRLATQIAKLSGIKHVAVISAQSSNKDIWVPSNLLHPLLYIRTMGEKEQATIDGGLPSASIFQPGFLNRLVGDRMFENILHSFCPSASLRVDTLAMAMVKDAEKQLLALQNSDKISDNSNSCRNEVRYFNGNGAITRVAA